MKKLFLLLLVVNSIRAFAQDNSIDSLQKLVAQQPADSNKVQLLASLGYKYLYLKPDTTFMLANEGLRLSSKIKYAAGKALCLKVSGDALESLGDYAGAL